MILTGENYSEWSSELENAFRAKRKFGFINGSLKFPDEQENPVETEMWRTANSMIVGWIRASILPTIRSTVPFSPDACKMWNELKKRFSVGSGVRVHQLKFELAACKQEGSSVMEYFGKLSKKWEELLCCKPLPLCTCAASDVYAKEYEEEKVHQFLMGLDEARYGNVVTTLIGSETLPDLNTVYQRVVREENRLGASRVETKEAPVGFNMKVGGDESSQGGIMAAVARGRSGVVCDHCGRSGHEKKECWQLIGFPEWFNERNQSGGRGGRGRGRGRTNSSRANAMHGTAASTNANSQTSGFPPLSSEQWASLASFLERQKQSPIPDKLNGNVQTGEVIIDTGASHHMTGDITLLSEVHSVIPSTVSFADGSYTMATKCGSLKLSENLTLLNVLYVRNLNCTLLSVAKLLRQTGCLAMFTDTLCVLQDRFTKTLIGAGEVKDGVYVYRDVTVTRGHRVKASGDQTLWHRRMGHPAFGVLSYLPFISGVKDVSTKFGGCDICFQSKQTRELFSESSNKSLGSFDLIHIDLWGRYRVSSSCGTVYFLTIVDDYSRAVWIHLRLEKSEVKTVLPNFISRVSRQFGRSVKTVRSDNGTEFVCLTKYFAEQGILHQTSCVNTPQQNGRVERKHRHILNVARSLLFQVNLPVSFWGGERVGCSTSY